MATVEVGAAPITLGNGLATGASSTSAKVLAPLSGSYVNPLKQELTFHSAMTSPTSGILEAYIKENALKYGDEVRLFVKSNYIKKPKPAWMDTEHKGWTEDELKGGYLGVYTKPDKTERVLVPPLGEFAHGTFVESYYRIEDVFSGQQSYGRVVTYGAVVVLVDDKGMVWNNKTGGLFLDGYLSPRPRGEPGEVFISFQKNGKRGEPVQYGDVGVYVDVEDSHRYRVGFNNRLTNYKGTFSSVIGGYISSDGSGEPLTFVVERYKGKIKPRPAAPQSESDQIPTSTSRLRLPPSMASISVMTMGVRDTMKMSPKFGSSVILYGLQPSSQVEIVLDNKSTVVVDGSEMVGSGAGTAKKVETTSPQGHKEIFHLTWKKKSRAEINANRAKEVPPTNPKIAIAFVKLLIAYFCFLTLLIFALGLYDQSQQIGSEGVPATMTVTRRGVASSIATFTRGFKRARFVAAFLCYLAGLVTPKIFFKARATSAYKSDSPTKGEVVLLTVTYEPGLSAPAPPPPTPRRVGASNGDVATPKAMASQAETMVNGGHPADGMENSKGGIESVQPWLAAGKDPVSGNPLHYAWVRFLNGERGNRETALKRWHITAEWRYENNIDGMLDRAHRLFFLIKAHYPHFYYGRSKYGNPIYIEQVGKVVTKNIRAGGGKLKDMIFHYIWTAEFMWNVLEPTEYGSSLTILDVEGIGFFDFAGEAVEFVKKATAVVQEHYPERGFMVFIINAPLWFTSIWAVVSTWVNPNTRDKIKILGKHYQDELFKVINRDQLPECYGGTNPRALTDSDEERMMRNVACRAMLKNNEVAVGPDGKPMTQEEIKAKIDSSVDNQMFKSKMSKIAPDGSLLCDEKGRPIEKKFERSKGNL